ncbi:MAG TPA: Fe-S protein assembly co-chaperone HscB [Gemmataceae bacterium]|jgi:molecular chaperone HscB
MSLDSFSRLGLPRRFALDAAELERHYLARSRAVHPDYHAARATADLAASLELSAALNEAYTTLRDPFARADHLLGLEGGPTAAEQKQMPPAFLAEMLEARERIEEARAANSPCSAKIAELQDEFTAQYETLLSDVGERFAKLESTPTEPNRGKILVDIRSLLNAAKYVRGLIRDLNE